MLGRLKVVVEGGVVVDGWYACRSGSQFCGRSITILSHRSR